VPVAEGGGMESKMTSKQRSYLKGLAMTMEPIFHVGKGSITPEIITALDEALEKRELIKVGVLKNCADDPHALAEVIADRTRSQVVQVIGKKMVFYRAAKKPKIELPRA
jgi:RNA-binding protein